MSQYVDLEMEEQARRVLRQAGLLDYVLRNRKWNQLIDVTAELEDGSRKLGWMALRKKESNEDNTLPPVIRRLLGLR